MFKRFYYLISFGSTTWKALCIFWTEMSESYLILKTDWNVYAKYDMDIIFRNILCSYFLSTNYSHHLINKKVIFKLASSRSLGHTWDFLWSISRQHFQNNFTVFTINFIFCTELFLWLFVKYPPFLFFQTTFLKANIWPAGQTFYGL